MPRPQLDWHDALDIRLDAGDLEILHAHLGLDVHRAGADEARGPRRALAEERRRRGEIPLVAGPGDDIGELEVGVLDHDLQRLGEGPILDPCGCPFDLEPIEGDVPREGLFDLLVDLDHLLLRLLRDQLVPGWGAVRPDPLDGLGALDDDRRPAHSGLRPGNGDAGCRDRRDLEDGLVGHSGLDLDALDEEVGFVDQRVRAVFGEEHRVREPTARNPVHNVELEERLQGRPRVLQVNPLGGDGPVEAEGLDHDIAGGADHAAALETDDEVVVTLVIVDGADVVKLELRRTDLPHQRLFEGVVLDVQRRPRHQDMLQEYPR